ncbi:Crp/Fnr family transcriptional regulator [Mucilaginibacter sp. RS28]|uniref:Crp/Fnr family transcriptional regulator n=1 Tax=Mucilaginibacter straminoryzae TaxID=2932774 RepID=A0A9X1X2P8_9SPHI|nr:Crp/Fnr family transcriptional regulator [Mucilaginibacter straminoryzae]MCJ8210162.1 Crp/Fnr family transcriptional regulator [Mucilaginibacter straminoryzae]
MDTLAATETFRDYLSRYITYTDEEWAIASKGFVFSTLKKKAYFAEVGKVSNELGFIYKGSARYLHIRNGEEITNYFTFAPDFISAYKSFLRREPGHNYIQMLEDSELVIVTHKHWHFMLEHPQLAHKTERLGRLIAEHYLCCYDDRVASFVTKSPEERYLELLDEGKEVIQRIPQHYIANFLGITPVSLSRIRRRILA